MEGVSKGACQLRWRLASRSRGRGNTPNQRKTQLPTCARPKRGAERNYAMRRATRAASQHAAAGVSRFDSWNSDVPRPSRGHRVDRDIDPHELPSVASPPTLVELLRQFRHGPQRPEQGRFIVLSCGLRDVVHDSPPVHSAPVHSGIMACDRQFNAHAVACLLPDGEVLALRTGRPRW
jgi:hypothetical protein